jgi:uncharacterized protein
MTPDPQVTSNAISYTVEELRTMQLPEMKPRPGRSEGEPLEADFEAYVSGETSVGVWECTPGCFPSSKSGVSEMMHFLSGRATITDADGTAHELGAGSMFLVVDGWRGEWQVHETVRKIYAIWPST